MIKIIDIRHSFPEHAGFFIDRKNGYNDGYTFLHFHNRVEIMQDGRKITAQPHAVIIFEPKSPQYFKSYEPLIHDWMHFDGNISELVKTENLPLNKICYPANFSFITETMAEIECEFFANERNRDELLQLKLEELLIKIDRSLEQREYQSDTLDMLEKFRFLRGKIFMSLDEKWSIERMSEQLHLSESRFYVLYKKFFGISPLSDIINAKINSAKNILLFRKKSVEEIAAMLGYQNTTHFIRQFKEYTGTTPAKYRKNNMQF